MSTTLKEASPCPNCGKPLPKGALAGLCPACLLAQGAETDAGDPAGGAHFRAPPLEEILDLAISADGETSSSPRRGDVFVTTRWTVVLTAGRKSSPQSDRALGELGQTYWYPLYAYVRRQDTRRRTPKTSCRRSSRASWKEIIWKDSTPGAESFAPSCWRH